MRIFYCICLHLQNSHCQLISPPPLIPLACCLRWKLKTGKIPLCRAFVSLTNHMKRDKGRERQRSLQWTIVIRWDSIASVVLREWLGMLGNGVLLLPVTHPVCTESPMAFTATASNRGFVLDRGSRALGIPCNLADTAYLRSLPLPPDHAMELSGVAAILQYWMNPMVNSAEDEPLRHS